MFLRRHTRTQAGDVLFVLARSADTPRLLDVRDAVEGLYLALTEPNAPGNVFNIAGPRPRRIPTEPHSSPSTTTCPRSLSRCPSPGGWK